MVLVCTLYLLCSYDKATVCYINPFCDSLNTGIDPTPICLQLVPLVFAFGYYHSFHSLLLVLGYPMVAGAWKKSEIQLTLWAGLKCGLSRALPTWKVSKKVLACPAGKSTRPGQPI